MYKHLLLLCGLCLVAYGQNITTQPANQIDIPLGDDAMFSVAVDFTPASFQWQRNGVDIMDIAGTYMGTDTANLTVLSVAVEDEGNYSVIVNGTIPSDSAVLTVLVVCPALDVPVNGAIDYSTTGMFIVGTTATYSCVGSNHMLTGGATIRTCQDNGTWSGDAPVCELIICPGLNVPNNGAIEYSNTMFTVGTVATYICETLYMRIGDRTRTCQMSGMWNGSEPTCDLITCPVLAEIPNGMIDYSSEERAATSTATYSCEYGYELMGDDVLTCQLDATWTPEPPSCVIVDCGSTDLTNPDNGMVSFTSTTFNSTATYSCDTGYRITGESTRVCNASSLWTPPAPTCDIIDCGPIIIMNGTANTPGGTTFNQTATYSCVNGYELSSSFTSVCMETGWSPSPPTCNIVDCGGLDDPMNGNVYTGAGTTFNSVALYGCDSGYMLVGAPNRTCGADGNWTNSAPTCEIAAPRIDVQPMDTPYLLPGENAVFIINVTGVGLTYEWTFNNSVVENTPGRFGGADTSVLTVYNVMDDDNEVVVSCTVNNSVDVVTSDDAMVRILGFPMVDVQPMYRAVTEGASTNFTCEATSDDGVINSIQFTTTSSATTAPPSVGSSLVLPLTPVSTNYSGVYTCIAVNRRGSVNASATLYVVVIQPIPDQTIPTGNNVTFACIVEGAPSVTSYRWFETIDGFTLFQDFAPETLLRVSGQDTAYLTISNVDFDDVAMYTCEVSAFGSVIDTETTFLNVSRPFVIDITTNVTLNTNDTLNISCTGQNPVGAVNDLFFIWLAPNPNRGNLDCDSQCVTCTNIGNNQAVGRLVIPLVTDEDSGIYLCYPANRMPFSPHNSLGATTDVAVFFTPELRFIIENDASSYRFQGRIPQTITCEVEAFPAATSAEIVEVVNGEELIRETDPNDVERMRFLVQYPFTPTLESNNRQFLCRASNRNGNTTISTVISVFDVPDMVNHSAITVDLLSLSSARVCFTPPNDNNDVIQFYSYHLCQFTCDNVPTPLRADVMIDGCFIIPDLVPESVYYLRLDAMNSAGFSVLPPANESVLFNSSTAADAALVDVMATVRTSNALVVTWRLPSMGRFPEIIFNRTIGMHQRNGADNNNIIMIDIEGVNMDFTSGISITGLEGDITYLFSIQGIYSDPILTSTTTEFNATTLRDGEEPSSLVDTPVQQADFNVDSLIISWTAPDIDFLVNYNVSYQIMSRRRKRQTGRQTFTVGPTETMFTIPDPLPVTDYQICVDGLIQPPGSDAPVAVPVTPQTTITTPELPPSAPENPTAVQSGNANPFENLDLSWDLPSMPGGPLRRCTIVFVRESRIPIQILPIGGVIPTTHTVMGLTANTLHQFQLFCSNSMEGASIGFSGMTRLGVEPALVSNQGFTATVIRVELAIRIGYGPVSHYQVIVSPVPIDDAEVIVPQNSAGNNMPYIALVSSVIPSNEAGFVISIGDTRTSSFNGITYTNSELVPGPNYYIFVRSFSGAGNLVNNSIVIQANIPAPVNVVAIIVPIAIIAVGLLIILIVLLFFAVWRLQGPPSRASYQPGRKGMTDGRRAQNIELRRTRMFAPMLNVGSPDVFTSAGQPTTLICEASGTPAPDITWSKNGEPLDKERFIQLADSSLFINDTDLQDEGEYVVSANNTAGDAEQLVKVTVLRPVPPEPDEEHPPVKSGEFTEKLALLRANDDEALEDEYTEIELDWTFTSYAAKLNINKNKNRYINIIPYDHARVALSLQDNTPGSDYINASFIDGYNAPNNYIATQGPIPSTFPDFWRMIWERDSPTIVMVTNLKEEDKVKCHQYWPSYGTTTYGNIQVTLKEVENLAEYSIRTFTVSPLAGQSRAQMPVREVRQFHFLVWPDHGVPQYATALLTFRKRVNRYHPEKRGPMVVHCSAGVGRTGTFITIDVCLKQIESEGNLDVFNFVRHMRFRRNYMVQTASQYVFIHDAVLESIMCGDNSIPAPELKTKLEQLEVVNPETGLSNYASQFETLKTASPADDEFDCTVAILPDNAAKNRFKEHLPSNEFRVTLSSEGDQSDYICASFLDGYRHRNNFIITQAPLEETLGDFWRMVWEQKSAAVIMLTQLEENGQSMAIKYWPDSTGGPMVFGAYQIELSEDEKNKGEYITRKLKLSPIDNPQESRIVTQFHYINWSKSTPPTDTHPILDLIDELQRVQRKSGNGPITVHCDDGLGRTGAFCTLYTVLERVKAEQVVDVFQAVKTLRIQRVGLMETLDEYVFVHKAVQEFLNSFSDYQNFK